MYWWLLTPILSGFLTWLEIDNTISITTDIKERRRFIRICFFLFIAVNSILSIVLYFILEENAALRDLRPPVRAFVVGIGYPALIRLKFTTLKVDDREVSIGLEPIYENIKNSLDKRIRRIVQEAEFEEVKNYANSKTLPELLQRAQFQVGQIGFDSEKRGEYMSWCESTANDEKSTEMDRKIFLADFILFNRRR